MSNRLHVSTRKGLFTLECPSKRGTEWTIRDVAFLGVPVTMSLADPREGSWYAALDHGHFGVHLHCSRDRGKHWEEIAVPCYPPDACVPQRMPTEAAPGEGPPTKPAILSEIWALETGGDDQPGVLWCGTIPGGLFRSQDAGSSWDLCESLWNRPERQQWFGGGKDDPGLHSTSLRTLHPRSSSPGGVQGKS